MVEMAMPDATCELEKLRAELAATKADLAQARAVVSTSEAMIAGLKLEIALLRREQYGHSAERTARLIDQLELQLEELVTDAAEDAIQGAEDDAGCGLRAQEAGAQTVPRASAARTRGRAGADRLHTAAAVGPRCASWARISPRRWRWCRGSGR
ncbi:MAG: transposase [Cypionkella sp.]